MKANRNSEALPDGRASLLGFITHPKTDAFWLYAFRLARTFWNQSLPSTNRDTT